MLSPTQIERTLKQCEKVHEHYLGMDMAGDEGPLYFEFMRNQG